MARRPDTHSNMDPLPSAGRSRVPRLGALLPTAVAIGAIVVLASLPDLGPAFSNADQAVEALHGRITAIGSADPADPLQPPTAQVSIIDGAKAGQSLSAYVEGPGGSQIVANYQIGDEVVVTVTRDQAGGLYTAVSDRWRAPLLGLFVLIFAASVVIVGGLHGIRALVSLGLTIALILKVLIPLLVGGFAPVPLAVLTAITVTAVSILLTEGWNRISGAAILGTAAALALTGLLAAGATAVASFTYTAGSDLAFLQTADGRGLDLRGMLLAALILGAVGVLDDVTVTQAALVESLATHGASGRSLIDSAMSVGRSHIAATVNTLFLAYVGAGLPLIVAIVVSSQSPALIFNSEEVATEVVRTIVGSLGIIAAVPVTTLVAAAVVTSSTRRRDRSPWARAAMPATVAMVALALALTAVLPLGSGRLPLSPAVLSPSSIPQPGGEGDGTALDPSAEPSSSGTAPSTPPDPVLLSPGMPYVLSVDGATVHITVTSIKATKVEGGWSVTADVTYRCDGPASFIVDPAAWSLITGTGENVPMRPPPTGGLEAGAIGPHAQRRGSMRGVVRSAVDQAFVAYSDRDGNLIIALPANGS